MLDVDVSVWIAAVAAHATLGHLIAAAATTRRDRSAATTRLGTEATTAQVCEDHQGHEAQDDAEDDGPTIIRRSPYHMERDRCCTIYSLVIKPLSNTVCPSIGLLRGILVNVLDGFIRVFAQLIDLLIGVFADGVQLALVFFAQVIQLLTRLIKFGIHVGVDAIDGVIHGGTRTIYSKLLNHFTLP